MSAPIWDDGDSLALPRLENDLDVDVCVVGLGGTGLTAVHELLRLGVRVAGIDAGRLASGAAGRNGGLLLAGLADSYHRAVAASAGEPARCVYLRTLAEIDVIEQTAPGSVYRTGSLRVAASPEEWEDCRLQMEAMRADGLSVEANEHPMGPALLFPQDAAFNPLARCRSLARAVVTGGALLFENSPAGSISGTLVRTPLQAGSCARR